MAETKHPGIELNVPSRAQRDLEQRHAAGYRPVTVDNTKNEVANPEVVVAGYAVEGNDTSAYLGVSPEYMTYANEADAPYRATEGVEADVLDTLQAGVPTVFRTEVPEDSRPADVGGQGLENLNTAVSGEDYSSELSDRPASVGPVRVVGAEAETSAPATSAPVLTKATTAKASTAKASN